MCSLESYSPPPNYTILAKVKIAGKHFAFDDQPSNNTDFDFSLCGQDFYDSTVHTSKRCDFLQR